MLIPVLTPKVISVCYDLPPEVIPYVKSKHNSFVERFGNCLMPVEHATTDRIWILTERWRCLLILDVGYMEIEAQAGWWLDWASIPGAAESITKRDERNGIVGATCHDIFFAFQEPTFEIANSLFYQIMRLEGTGTFKAWYKWAAVSSSVGYEAWEESSNPLRQQIESNWLSVKTVPVVSPRFAPLLSKRPNARR